MSDASFFFVFFLSTYLDFSASFHERTEQAIPLSPPSPAPSVAAFGGGSSKEKGGDLQ